MNNASEEIQLRAGEWVVVRSKEEILSTLDPNGCLEGMPFMPEMLAFCGKRFQVFKRAHKTCDTVNKTGGRSIHAAVHLNDLRCDGKAHGGCEAACLIFWKEAWLKRCNDSLKTTMPVVSTTQSSNGCTEKQVWAATTTGFDSKDLVYSCQATELPRATAPLSSRDIRQYWEDLASGNVRLHKMVNSFVFRLYHRLINLGIGIGLGSALRRLYDQFQKLRGGPPYPFCRGKISPGTPTPHAELNLQPGELVRIKPLEEILGTLDEQNKNRGLYFDCEEVPFCGGVYKVRSRVGRLINEKTGRMMEMKTSSVILENVYCTSRYSDRRLFCPRAIYPMWREIWLERVEPDSSKNSAPGF